MKRTCGNCGTECALILCGCIRWTPRPPTFRERVAAVLRRNMTANNKVAAIEELINKEDER